MTRKTNGKRWNLREGFAPAKVCQIQFTFLLVVMAFIKITSCLEEHTEIETEKRKRERKDQL